MPGRPARARRPPSAAPPPCCRNRRCRKASRRSRRPPCASRTSPSWCRRPDASPSHPGYLFYLLISICETQILYSIDRYLPVEPSLSRRTQLSSQAAGSGPTVPDGGRHGGGNARAGCRAGFPATISRPTRQAAAGPVPAPCQRRAAASEMSCDARSSRFTPPLQRTNERSRLLNHQQQAPPGHIMRTLRPMSFMRRHKFLAPARGPDVPTDHATGGEAQGTRTGTRRLAAPGLLLGRERGRDNGVPLKRLMVSAERFPDDLLSDLKGFARPAAFPFCGAILRLIFSAPATEEPSH